VPIYRGPNGEDPPQNAEHVVVDDSICLSERKDADSRQHVRTDPRQADKVRWWYAVARWVMFRC